MNGNDIKYTSGPARLMSTLIPLLLIFLPLTSADAQVWRLQNSGTTVELNKIFFVDTLRGWAVGERGTILNTTDGGTQWTRQQSPDTNATYNSVYFTDSINGYAIGLKGMIVKTTNGGRHWFRQDFSLPRFLNDVFFLSPDTGWIVGGGGTFGTILRTYNGGMKWDVLRDLPYGGSCYAVHFIDQNKGWIVGFNGMDLFDPDLILHTTDGGDTWQEQISPRWAGLRDVSFYNAQIGWATGVFNNWGIALIKTTDGGASWKHVGPARIATFKAVEAVDSVNLWIAGQDIYKSTDGGDTWELDATLAARGMTMKSKHHGWVCGTYGEIWRYHPQTTSVNPFPENNPQDLAISIHPSPQNRYATVTYHLQRSQFITTDLYNILGSKLRTIVDAEYTGGEHTVKVDLTGFPKGMYVLRTAAGNQVHWNKLMIGN